MPLGIPWQLVLLAIVGWEAIKVLLSLVWQLILPHHLTVRILMSVTQRHYNLAEIEDLIQLVLPTCMVVNAVLSGSQKRVCHNLLSQILLLTDWRLVTTGLLFSRVG